MSGVEPPVKKTVLVGRTVRRAFEHVAPSRSTARVERLNSVAQDLIYFPKYP